MPRLEAATTISPIATSFAGGTAYVTTDSKVVRLALTALPMGEPVFLAVGHIPSTSITDGYAIHHRSVPMSSRWISTVIDFLLLYMTTGYIL